ncbi:MAG: hypothetical protein LBE55_04980 [Clostridiales bacterium]|jgi:hypothetical protein|nr:hypothetical protein [Clostridiales bacterium]
MMKVIFAALVASMVLVAPQGAETMRGTREYFDSFDYFVEHPIFWSGEVYESEFFGLSFELPDDWHGTSLRNIPEDIGFDLFFDGLYFMATHITDASDIIRVYMTYTHSPDATIESIIDARIASNIASNEEFAEQIFEMTQGHIEWIYEVTVHDGHTRIGAHYWYSYESRSYMTNIGAEANYSRTFIRINDGIVKSILINYRNIDELRDVLAMFRPY